MSSDEEYEYEYESDADYGSEDNEDEQDDNLIEIENAYYEGDDCHQDDPQKALEMFQRCVTLETERGDEVKWRFKALEHLVTLQFRLDQHDEMVQRYKELLSYMGAVTRNECTDAINGILDTISSSSQIDVLSQMYEITLDALRAANNERLWFNTHVKLGKLHLKARDHGRLQRVIRDLHRTCQLPDGTDDPAKGTYLLEVYALEIQLCTATMNTARMKLIYPKTLDLNAAIADPRIMGVIREEGGKMYMSEENWAEAYNEFYEGFVNYQEAGNTRARDCLKYVVLANMLAVSDINPFAAPEAKVYQEEKEIMAMMALRSYYETNDIVRFEKTLRDKQNKILDDPFIMTYVDPLLRKMREQVLLNLIRPYQRIRLAFVSDELRMPLPEVESLLVDMILDSRVQGKIDQTRGVLILEGDKTSATAKNYSAVDAWASSLESLLPNVIASVH